MDSCEREMTPVTLTIINTRKGYLSSRGSNQQPPVLECYMLLTELRGLDSFFLEDLYNKSVYGDRTGRNQTHHM